MGIYQRSGREASAAPRRATLLRLGALAFTVAVPAAQAQVSVVPTPPEVVERMLTMAKITKADYLIDLGSGEGPVVRAAARLYGARGLGVDMNAERVARSNELARGDGVADKVSFTVQDPIETDVSAASVVALHPIAGANVRLRPRLLSMLPPGARIVSHDFDLGDWAADETAEVYAKQHRDGRGATSKVSLWVVPADVSGRWQWQLETAGQKLEYELTTTQRFQQLQAAIRVDGAPGKLEQMRLSGDTIDFVLVSEIKGSTVRQRFSGRVVADEIHGNVVLSGVRLQGLADWSAKRSSRGERLTQPHTVHGTWRAQAALETSDTAREAI